MGKDRLEEYIKDQIKDHHSEVNPDAIWAAIAQPEQKKKKPFYWIFGALAILMLGVLAWNLIFTNTNETLINDQNKLAQKEGQVQTNNFKTDTNEKLLKGNTYSEGEISKQEIITDAVKPNDSQEKTIAPLKDNGAIINEPSVTKTEITKSIVNTPVVNSQETNTNYYTPIDISRKIEKRKAHQAGQHSTKVATAKPINKSQINTPMAGSKLTNKSLDFITTATLANAFNGRLIYSRPITPQKLSQVKLDIAKEIDIAEKNTKSAWFLSGHYGYYSGTRDLSATPDTMLDTTILSLRNSQEKFMEAWELGAMLGYRHHSGFILETGISYTQINDRAIVPLRQEQFLFPSSSYREIVKEITVINQYRFHKIRMIDLPIHLSYEKEFSKWSIRPGAGINVNIRTISNGNISGLQGLVDVSTIRDFKSNIGYNLEAKLQVGYQLSENLQLNLSSSYKHYPNSFTTGNISQQYKLWGIKLGLSKYF